MFFIKIEKTESTKPIITIVGANFILLKLKISELKIFGSLLPPPDIKIKPIAIIINDKNKIK
tara:strand:+ start:1121 stop:1306 length:186 start_codon:yes stop_codon:yes gene_type:complete